ncbi:MAG: rhomboid family intramembrane serine protease [Epulopiscium sp.]|nr:rhomboid family intramembrane serine protease [Candidatus Epulonipiscium sp.]
MFTRFIHNAYPVFVEEGFELLSDRKEVDIFSEDIDVVRFIKRHNTILYIINFWNMLNIDYDTFFHRNASYEKKLREFFEQLNCSHIIVLNLLITEEAMEFNNISEFHPGKDIYSVSWIVQLPTKKILVNKGDTDEVLNVKQLVHKVFNIIDPTYESEEENFRKYRDRIKRKIPLKERSSNTVLTYGLIGINIVIWLLMELNGGSQDVNTLLSFGANEPFLVLKRDQYWRLVTSMFLHIGLSHLLYNSFALYLFGTRIERYYGKIKYLLIYFISGTIGSIASIFFSNTVSAGASGAIYGLLGALLYLAYKTRKEIDGLNTYTILVMALIGIGLGWIMPSIDNAAHVAGFLSGLFTGKTLICPWSKEK